MCSCILQLAQYVVALKALSNMLGALSTDTVVVHTARGVTNCADVRGR